MLESPRELRAELTEAIERVRRELEILRSPSSIGGGADSLSVIGDLERELKELLAARAGL